MFHTPAHKQTDPAKQPAQREGTARIEAAIAAKRAGGGVGVVQLEPLVQPCPNGPVNYGRKPRIR